MENANPDPKKSLLFLYFELQREMIFTQILYHICLETFFRKKQNLNYSMLRSSVLKSDSAHGLVLLHFFIISCAVPAINMNLMAE